MLNPYLFRSSTVPALILLLLLSLPAVGQTNDWWKMQDSKAKPEKPKARHKEKIGFVYDKFKDITVLQLEYMHVGDGVAMGVFASAKGQVAPSTDTAILLAFSLYNERWRCLDGCNVTFLIDGERLKLGTADNIDREIGGAYGVIERIGLQINYETLKRIAFAHSVEFQAGSDEATLTSQHLAALQDFASRFRGINQN